MVMGRPIAIGLLVLLAGCSGADQSATVQAIPFTTASITSIDDRAFNIAWTAPSAHAVRLYAGTDPAHVGRDRPVGQGGATGALAVNGLPDAARWYFELVPDIGQPLTLADRSLHLATAPNFRDAGGYRTFDGKWIRMGLLYRSDQLDLLSPADLQTIHAVGVHLFCDLRTGGERMRGPDRVPEGGVSLIADVAGSDSASARLARLFVDKSVQQDVRANGGSAKLMIDANRQFVSSPSARGLQGRFRTAGGSGHAAGSLPLHGGQGPHRLGPGGLSVDPGCPARNDHARLPHEQRLSRSQESPAARFR